jgi:hypothetical protein
MVTIVFRKNGMSGWKIHRTNDNLKGEIAELEDAEGAIVACRDM